MSVLTKDEFMTRLEKHFDGDTSDDTIKFVEDMTDTYNDLEKRYNDNDTAWKEKYKKRFFSSVETEETEKDNDKEQEKKAEKIQIDDLFN